MTRHRLLASGSAAGMAAAEPEGLASLLRASEGDTAAWVGHVVAFRAYLQRSDSPGLLNMSPPALQALVECVRTCVTGSEQDAEGERLTPLAEMLRALFDLLPKPQEGANLAQPDHPLVQPMRTLSRTCIVPALRNHGSGDLNGNAWSRR